MSWWNRLRAVGQQWGDGRGPLQKLTDAQAIAASGDSPREFSVLFERHYPAIHRYVHRRLDRSLADDLASETFAIAFRERGRYDDRREDARPWLFGIAANLIRHHRRTERRRLLAYSRIRPDLPDPGFDNADARADALRVRPTIARALASLRATDREILLLHAWAELTYEQIAAALDLPVGTVRSRLSRARHRIRELMEASGQFSDDGNEAWKEPGNE